MTTCWERAVHSVNVFSYFPFGFAGRIWDLIVSVPDHCSSFNFGRVESYLNVEKYTFSIKIVC